MSKLLSKILIVFLLTIFFTETSVQAVTIVLDPGHGGKDSGAVNGKIHEADVTLKIAKYLKEYLNDYKNVSVILTHEGLQSNEELIIFDRAMIARENKANLLVSLHINSSTGTAQGAEVYVTANKSLDKYNKETTELANKIIKNLNSIGITTRGENGIETKLIPKDTTDVYSDGTRADYMGIIRYAMRGTMIDSGKVTVIEKGKKLEVPAETSANIEKGEGIPTILVEHCFIQGNDLKYIDSDEDIKKLAEADGKAIVEQYGLSPKKTEPKENKNIKLDESNKTITIMPTVDKEQLTSYLGSKDFSILDKDGKETEKISTGGKIKIKNVTYSIIKMGDVNGDGKVKANDALAVLKHSMGTSNLEGVYAKAAEVINANKVKATDALAILKYSMGLIEINL